MNKAQLILMIAFVLFIGVAFVPEAEGIYYPPPPPGVDMKKWLEQNDGIKRFISREKLANLIMKARMEAAVHKLQNE